MANVRPNIFSFAKKELSQDAFLAWLITWAHPDNKEHDPRLHECAQDFVRQLLGSFAIEARLEIDGVWVDLQWNKIDVCVEVYSRIKNYLIVIENKVDSGEHSNQLLRYKDIAQTWCGDKSFELHCIYLKTGNEPLDSLNKTEAIGYRLFSRKHMLALVRKYENIENNILTDFRINLENIEESLQMFTTKPIGKDWNKNDWIGLFSLLDEKQIITRWHYVSNPAGGFQNALLNWHEWNNVFVYAQIEEGRLCYKISFDPEDAKVDLLNLNLNEIQDEWQNILLSGSKVHANETVQAIKRPNRYLHQGKWRTIAVVDRKDWLGEEGGIVDIDRISYNLNAHKKFIQDCLKITSAKTL